MLESASAWAPVEWNLTTADHYAVLPWGPHLYLGYIAENKVKLFTRGQAVLEVGGCTQSFLPSVVGVGSILRLV